MALELIVEDGSGVTGANAYLNQEAFEAEAEISGWVLEPYEDAQIVAAIIRGRRAIDRRNWIRWAGEATYDNQVMAWPRSGVVTNAGLEYPEDKIPQDVIDASAEAAWRELQSPGSMSPDLERGGLIASLKAGSVEIVYADGATPETVFTTINDLLGSWLLPLPSATTVTWPLRA